MGDSKQLVAMAIEEVSGVDRPANQIPGWLLEKMEGALDVLSKKDYTAEQRKTMAANGQALPDGSFPIANVADLKNAIRAIGRASDPAKAKAHIRSRAKALGASDLIPDDWGKMTDNIELSAEEHGLFTKLIDFLRKSDAPKEGEVTTEEHEAALEAVRAEQADAIKKAVDEALAAKDEELKKAAELADAEAKAAEEAAAAEAAKAGEGTEEVTYAKAEDLDALRKEFSQVTEVLDKVTDALTAVLEKTARKTSLEDAPADDDKSKMKKTVSGLFDSAIKNPGKVIEMTGPRQ